MRFGRAVQTMASLSLLITLSFSSLVTIPEEASAYTTRDPIMIWANDEFTPANGVTGGSGTSSDPYIIEGWEIDAPYPYKAISMRWTDAHFIIRNNHLSAGGGSVTYFYEMSNGTIEDNVVSGDVNQFCLGRASNFSILNNFVTGGSYYGGGSISVVQSTDVTISGNIIRQFGMHGGEVVGTDIIVHLSVNVTITGNEIIDTSFGIDLSGYAYDVSITNNNIDVDHKGIRVGMNSDNATIVDNVISTPTFRDVDIILNSTENNVIQNNTMSGGGIYIQGYSLEHWNTHEIAPTNTVNGRPVRYWKNATSGIVETDAGQLIVANCSGVLAKDLDLEDIYAPLQVGFSRNSMIIRNRVHDNSWGVTLLSSSSYIIAQNNVSNNREHGIYIENSTNTEIFNNTFRGNRVNGINLDFSSHNTIFNNTAFFNGKDGVNLFYSNNNTISENVFMSNQRGIRLIYSKSNRIYHNNIIGNVEQAIENLVTQSNDWDDGYPSGGNYWSDYVGEDNRRGPDQNQPGKDGIGDMPYSIYVNSQDRYPLLQPPAIPPPQPPTLLEAELVGVNLIDVTITWALSPDDGTGLGSVVGYELFRSTTYDWGGEGYQLVASLPNGTTNFVDYSVGVGDPNNYFYRVCAVDANSDIYCARDQAGKFTRPLPEGPNLVSIPLVQSDESVEMVLQTVKFDKIWTYDSTSKHWKSYAASKPYKGDLGSVGHRDCFWINVIEDSDLTVAGIVPLIATTQLRAGWNLVPFSYLLSTFTVSDLAAATGATRVEGLDPLSSPYFLRVLAPGEVLEVGHGYWIMVGSDRTWTISNS